MTLLLNLPQILAKKSGEGKQADVRVPGFFSQSHPSDELLSPPREQLEVICEKLELLPASWEIKWICPPSGNNTGWGKSIFPLKLREISFPKQIR